MMSVFGSHCLLLSAVLQPLGPFCWCINERMLQTSLWKETPLGAPRSFNYRTGLREPDSQGFSLMCLMSKIRVPNLGNRDRNPLSLLYECAPWGRLLWSLESLFPIWLQDISYLSQSVPFSSSHCWCLKMLLLFVVPKMGPSLAPKESRTGLSIFLNGDAASV